jgi:hypothetical protein
VQKNYTLVKGVDQFIEEDVEERDKLLQNLLK